ncbi:SURF1 family protein [Cognatishimia sp.]|uniref:SURF1 family protein n=1 Tax=Cognatishimia sp. TaxID=2211648 RepID=UPI00351212CE
MQRLILPLGFGIIGIVILVSLGNWQMRRLAWKEDILAQIDARIAAETVPLPEVLDPEADRFLAVQVDGQMTTDELHVYASTKTTGAIYRVIAAFETTDGRRILVDRGWIKPEFKDSPRAASDVVIEGNLHWPEERDSYTPENDLAGNIWFARDVEAMAAALNTAPILVVARETSQTNPAVTPLPVTSTGIPNDHLNYAVTWYGLALVWLAMTLYYLRRMRAKHKV